MSYIQKVTRRFCPFRRLGKFVLMLLLCIGNCALSSESTYRQGNELRSVQIDFGTLEIVSKPKVWAYLFRFDGKEEVYDNSPDASKPWTENFQLEDNLPGMCREGLELDNGVRLRFSDLKKSLEEDVEELINKYPGHQLTYEVFRNRQTDDVLRIKIKGKTKVCRVRIHTANERVYTVWRAME